MDKAQKSSEDAVGSGRRKRRGADEWRELIRRQRDGGQSVAAFCRQHGLSQPGFYAWRRRLDPLMIAAAAAPSGFVRLDPVAPATDAVVIEVRFDCGATLRWPGDRLGELVRALADGGRSC